MVSPLLVAVVEPVDPGDHDPAGDRREQERVLACGAEMMVGGRAGAECELDDGEGRG